MERIRSDRATRSRIWYARRSVWWCFSTLGVLWAVSSCRSVQWPGRRSTGQRRGERRLMNTITRVARTMSSVAIGLTPLTMLLLCRCRWPVLSPASGHSLVSLVMTPLVQTVSRQLRRPVPWNVRRPVERRISAPADMKYDNFLGTPQCTTKVNCCSTKKRQHNYLA